MVHRVSYKYSEDETVSYYQWETISAVAGRKKKRASRWIQVQNKGSI